jgi:hypothetical protein
MVEKGSYWMKNIDLGVGMVSEVLTSIGYQSPFYKARKVLVFGCCRD